MKILIATDFSPVGRKAAFYGYKLAQKSGMDSIFFHAIPQPAKLLEGYGIKAVISGSAKAEHKIIEDSARKNLHKLMEAVILENGKSPDTQIDEYIAAGDASEEILKYAKEQSADMIVIGYKSYSAISEILVGSTAAKVARYAPCSVLIYRPDKA